MAPDYAELHCLSNFSFLRGASHPQELVEQAAALGYRALAITDECSVAGVVRAWQAAREYKLHLLIGSEFRLEDGLRLVLLATDRQGYGQLCRLITRGRRQAPKGQYRLTRNDLATALDHCLALWLAGTETPAEEGGWMSAQFPGRCWIAVELLADGEERQRQQRLQALGRKLNLPLVACGDVHMHVRKRRALQDTLTAIRLRRPLGTTGRALFANGERHLRPRDVLAEIYPPAMLAESLRIAGG